MDKVIKKYSLKDNQQELDDKRYWQSQSIEFKLEILESVSRLHKAGWKHIIELEEGIQQTYTWFVKNADSLKEVHIES